MKARIKNSNKIVDVYFDYFYGLWAVKGNPEAKYASNGLELLEEKDIDWEERRYEIAKVMMMVLERHNNNVSGFSNLTEQAKFAIECADALITELKKRRMRNDN